MLLFQSNKKKKRDRLWRARVKQPTTISSTTSAPQMPATATIATRTSAAAAVRIGADGKAITNNTINNMAINGQHLPHYQLHNQQMHQQFPLSYQHQQHQQLQLPQMNNCHPECFEKCSIVCYSNQQHQQQQQLEPHQNSNCLMSNCSIGERSDTSMIDCQENYTSGYYCESTGSITDYDEDQTMLTIGYQQKSQYQHCQPEQNQGRHLQTTNIPSVGQSNLMTTATAAATTISSTMALTAANVFRNCCGGGFLTDSTLTINSNNNNCNNYHNIEKSAIKSLPLPPHQYQYQYQQQQPQQLQQPIHSYSTNSTNPTNMNDEDPDFLLFRTLIKKLKDPQLTTLCQTIDLIKSASAGNAGGSNSSGNGCANLVGNVSQSGHQPDCVLVPRGTIMGQEPNVIACRLWRWPDLRNSYELKSIPSCPNEKDRVYVCCNPSHWSRICMPDTPPPPYQSIAMERLKPEERAPSERMKGGENSNSIGSSHDNSTNKKHGGVRRQFPGSLTTDGEDSSLLSSSWCELAYWELAQRVGGRFPVENSSINIFWDQFRGDGMCLKTLAEQRQKLPPDSVIKARLKIGLGVTLSQEADSVWLYNRSSAPVFVHSPTLNNIDNWFNVTKVPPGYCLKAFDNYKAKTKSFVWPPQIAGAQTGPIDTMSMRISFAKGWGPTYTRQDVTACPCWLEVLLTRNR